MTFEPDHEIHAVIEALNFETPWFSMSGDEGTVYFLEDGRVLKLTSSEVEAATSIALMELQVSEGGHSCLPRIDSIH